MNKTFKDLCCGDVFRFNGTNYVCLSNHGDPLNIPHTVVTCLRKCDFDSGTCSTPTAIKADYNFPVFVEAIGLARLTILKAGDPK